MLLSTAYYASLPSPSFHFQSAAWPKSKAMFFYDDPACMIWGCKIQPSMVIIWHYWENGHFEQNFKSLHKHYQYVRNSIFTRHISQHLTIISLVLQSITLTLHLGYPSRYRM